MNPQTENRQGRLSDLLDASAFAADGTSLGSVRDVRLIQDGPYVEGFGQALRLDGVVVGRRWHGIRLGFLRADVSGPWPLSRLFRALERRARYFAWEDVASWQPGEIRLRSGATPTEPG
jgi:hypothetical protein